MVAMTPLVARYVMGSANGKTGGSGLLAIPEGRAVFSGTSPPSLVPQLLPPVPLVTFSPTILFKSQGEKLFLASIPKLPDLYQAWDLQRLKNALRDKKWHDLLDSAHYLFQNCNFPTRTAALLRACFSQHYHKATIKDMVALISEKLQ